jgi:hypothetical protein
MILHDITHLAWKLKDNLQKIQSLNNSQNNVKLGSSKIKQTLIIFTKSSDLIIMDALSGNVLHSLRLPDKEVYQIVKSEDYQFLDDKSIYIIFHDKKNKKFYTSLELNLDTMQLKPIEEIYLKEEELKEMIVKLINSKNDSSQIGGGKLDNRTVKKFNNKVLVHSEANKLYGINFKSNGDSSDLNLSIIWNQLMDGSKIISTLSPQIHKNLISTYHANGKVFYKYLDTNMLLVLSSIESKESKSTLYVTIIKTNNGKILYQGYLHHVDFNKKIITVFEENIVLISYTRKEKSISRNELFVIEIMKREIEHSFIHLLEKIFKVNLVSDYDFSNESFYDENIQESDLLFLTQTFITSKRIKDIKTSKTLLNMANKFFVVIFENNQVFFVDKRGLSPRRPLMREEKGKPPVLDPELNSPYIDPELTPYHPLINLDTKYILDINFAYNQIDDVLISPTEYESTLLVCTLGLNISCDKVYPDKTFDTMLIGIPYSLIIMFISGIMVINIFYFFLVFNLLPSKICEKG